jgi:hypothetical protein
MIYKNSGERLRDAIEQRPRTMEKMVCGGKCGLPTLARNMDLFRGICYECIAEEKEEYKEAAENFEYVGNFYARQ